MAILCEQSQALLLKQQLGLAPIPGLTREDMVKLSFFADADLGISHISGLCKYEDEAISPATAFSVFAGYGVVPEEVHDGVSVDRYPGENLTDYAIPITIGAAAVVAGVATIVLCPPASAAVVAEGATAAQVAVAKEAAAAIAVSSKLLVAETAITGAAAAGVTGVAVYNRAFKETGYYENWYSIYRANIHTSMYAIRDLLRLGSHEANLLALAISTSAFYSGLADDGICDGSLTHPFLLPRSVIGKYASGRVIELSRVTGTEDTIVKVNSGPMRTARIDSLAVDNHLAFTALSEVGEQPGVIESVNSILLTSPIIVVGGRPNPMRFSSDEYDSRAAMVAGAASFLALNSDALTKVKSAENGYRTPVSDISVDDLTAIVQYPKGRNEYNNSTWGDYAATRVARAQRKTQRYCMGPLQDSLSGVNIESKTGTAFIVGDTCSKTGKSLTSQNVAFNYKKGSLGYEVDIHTGRLIASDAKAAVSCLFGSFSYVHEISSDIEDSINGFLSLAIAMSGSREEYYTCYWEPNWYGVNNVPRLVLDVSSSLSMCTLTVKKGDLIFGVYPSKQDLQAIHMIQTFGIVRKAGYVPMVSEPLYTVGDSTYNILRSVEESGYWPCGPFLDETIRLVALGDPTSVAGLTTEGASDQPDSVMTAAEADILTQIAEYEFGSFCKSQLPDGYPVVGIEYNSDGKPFIGQLGFACQWDVASSDTYTEQGCLCSFTEGDVL